MDTLWPEQDTQRCSTGGSSGGRGEAAITVIITDHTRGRERVATPPLTGIH